MLNTTLCYIERGDAWLLLHRVKKKNDLNKNKWVGIGGKFKPGETPEQCVLREVWEETGLLLNRYRYRGLITFVSDRWPAEYMHLYSADGFTGELRDCDEGKLEWVKKSDVAALPQWEGDKLFLRLLDEGAEFFTLVLQYRGEKLVRVVLNGKRLAGYGD